MRNYQFNLIAIIVAALVISISSPTFAKTLKFNSLGEKAQPLSGELHLPKTGNKPFPVVVLVHGTGFSGERYNFHRPAFLEAGIATFEVDFHSGIFTGSQNRPKAGKMVPFAYGALRALRNDPSIDGNKIAIMGFSLGGAITVKSMRLVLKKDSLDENEKGFAGHVAFYPACKRQKIDPKVTGAPLLVLNGELDTYSDGKSCESWAKKYEASNPGLVTMKIYPGVHHGFDMKGYHKGKDSISSGGISILEYNEKAAKDSRQQAVEFLKNIFEMT